MSEQRTVALLEQLPAAQRQLLESVLPADWRLEEREDSVDRAEALIVRDAVVDHAVLERAPHLRSVVQIDVGQGSVDHDACRERGVAVELIPSPSLMSVAEHAVMAMLMLLKRQPEASARLRAGEVAGDAEPELTTQERYAYNWVGLAHFDALWGQTVGLVGLGRIGGHVAQVLRAFGAEVVYTKRTRLAQGQERALGVRYLPLEELLQASRIVSLHNRFTAETEQMMDARAFARMQPGAFFVNTARGRLVDEQALVEALRSGRLAGAALDVFQHEPLPPDSPLLDPTLPNLILTPHTGGIPSAESQDLELREAARRLPARALSESAR